MNKFAVWYKPEKAWVNNNFFTVAGDGELWYIQSDEPEHFNKDDFVICQYLGKRDCDGTEIKEFDLLQDIDYAEIFYLEWDKVKLTYKVIFPETKLMCRYERTLNIEITVNLDRCKIVGNMCERNENNLP